ncbi:MAG: type II toxin-antitoxin system Phd/YefM family antitoxin [Thermoleophilia bacterium]|jgi:prevent-host-death family protein
MEEIVPISDLQSQAKKHVEAAKSGEQRFIITQRGRPAAVLIGYDDYRVLLSFTATAIEKADPEALEMLRIGMRQLRAGQMVELEEILKKQGRKRTV